MIPNPPRRNGAVVEPNRGLWAFGLSLLVLLVATPSFAQPGVVRFDFESGDLEGWRVVEGAFGELVSDRAVFHNAPDAYNKHGTFFLSTLEREDERPDDRFVGLVESPVFVLTAPDMAFLVGGGKHAETYVALCTLDGKEAHKACGKGAERMERAQWHAPELVGRPVFLRVVDRHTRGWGHVTFDYFVASGRLDAEATEARFAKAERETMRREIRDLLAQVDLEALRAAVQDLARTFPSRYAHARDRIERLAGFEKRVADLNRALANDKAVEAAAVRACADGLRAFQREALMANPLVSGRPMLYVVRKQYRSDHHNTATLFQAGEINAASFEGGGALKTIDFARGGDVKTLLDTREGLVRDPDVHFDGKRVVFAMRQDREDDYHLYEIEADGTGLRQLTRAEGVSDIDPLYLPDDTIAFSSTREPKYCMCNRHIMCNLFRMEADGANIHQIGKSTLFEGHGSLTPDGRILYDRWEYVDRNFGDAQGLWTVFPDGANHAVYWGNNTWSPGSVLDPRVIPGTQQVVCGTQQVLCVFGSCHDRPWGALAIVDRRRALDGRPPVVRTWPADAIELVHDGHGKSDYGFDVFKRVNPKYEDPYPLSDKYFLCSRMTGDGEQMGLHLVDVFGNEILLHVEGPGCFDPMPLGPRPRPPVIPNRRDFENGTGQFYVADVYRGTHMAGVAPGAVKYLRVVESPEKRFWTHTYWGGQGVHCPAMNWHDFCNKRILGAVPVEEDGSAYFEAPSDTFLYFQVLDEDGMMIQSMRSGVMVQSGERLGCIGCHEERRTAPAIPNTAMPLALRRPPSRLEGWYGPPRLFNYQAEVQPVFDQHCIRCHDYEGEAGGTLNLAGDQTLTFNTSYNTLWRKKLIKAIGAGPVEVQPAYSWGSHASRLVEALREGHEQVALSTEEFDRIVTWIDINAPYYPRYASAYPANLAGRSPLSPPQLKRLDELTGVPFDKLAGFAQNRGPQVSFDRPEFSPCLAPFEDQTDPAYQEALAIIQAGQAKLEERPRADMTGFELHGTEAKREDKYSTREQVEVANRQAIREHRRTYDE